MIKKKSKYEPGNYKFVIKRSSAGLGLFAGEELPKGVCLLEYKGRRISEKEEYTSRSKYLFGVTKKKTIDGATRSNTARYINHSCRPNTEIKIKNERVWVFSRRKIKPGEEISYDYGKEYWNEHIKPKGCHCLKCQKIKAK